MSRRVRLYWGLPATAAVLVLVAAVSAGCRGNPTGECVIAYRYGDVTRYTTDKNDCEESCAYRLAGNPDLITACYFVGSLASPTEP